MTTPNRKPTTTTTTKQITHGELENGMRVWNQGHLFVVTNIRKIASATCLNGLTYAGGKMSANDELLSKPENHTIVRYEGVCANPDDDIRKTAYDGGTYGGFSWVPVTVETVVEVETAGETAERVEDSPAPVNATVILNRVNDYLATVSEDRNYEAACMAFELIDAAGADVHNAVDTPNFPSQVANVLALFDIRIARDQADQAESATATATASAPAVTSGCAMHDTPSCAYCATMHAGDVAADLSTSADAVLVINSPARARVAGMAAFLTLQGVAHVHETVGLVAAITVLRADVAYVLDHWRTFSNEGAAAMIAQLEADRAAGVTVWPVDASTETYVGTPIASPARSIRQSHVPTARENRYTRIAATAAQMDLTELRVLANEFGGAAQGTAWELDAHSKAWRAVRDALAARLATERTRTAGAPGIVGKTVDEIRLEDALAKIDHAALTDEALIAAGVSPVVLEVLADYETEGKDWALRAALATESPAPAIRVVLATRTRVLALCEQLELFQLVGANDIANCEPVYRLVAPSEQTLATATMPAEYAEPTRSNILAMVERLGLFVVVVDPAKYVAGEPVYRLRADVAVVQSEPEQQQQEQDDDDSASSPEPEPAPAAGPGPYIALGSCCDDCVQAIANDDYTGMDDATERAVRKGIAAIGQSLIVGDEEGFSWRGCDVCGGAAGNRHEVGYLAARVAAPVPVEVPTSPEPAPAPTPAPAPQVPATITDAWDVIKQVVRDCAGTESSPLMLGNVELWIDSADGSLVYSLPVAAWDMAAFKRDLAERLTIIANNTRGRARLGGEIVAALAAVVARVTFSNLLTKDQVLYVYRHTGIMAEELPKKPGEVLRKRLSGEDAGVVVRFSRHHQKSTYDKPLWLCEHIVAVEDTTAAGAASDVPEPYVVKVRGVDVAISSAIILETREHFAVLAETCIADMRAGKWKVNDVTAYVENQTQFAADVRAGKSDHTATFRQFAVYLVTGESVGLLG